MLVDFLADDDEGHDGDARVSELAEALAEGGVDERFAGDEDAVELVFPSEFLEFVGISQHSGFGSRGVTERGDGADKVEVLQPDVGEDAHFPFIKRAGNNIRDALLSGLECEEEVGVVRHREQADDDRADGEGDASKRLGFDEVRKGNERAQGKQEAHPDQEEPAVGAAIYDVGGVKARDVEGGRKRDAREHEMGPVLPNRIDPIVVFVVGHPFLLDQLPNEVRAADDAEYEECSIEQKVQGHLDPVLL